MVGNGPALYGPVTAEKAIRLRAVFESSNDVCRAVYETGSILLCALLCDKPEHNRSHILGAVIRSRVQIYGRLLLRWSRVVRCERHSEDAIARVSL